MVAIPDKDTKWVLWKGNGKYYKLEYGTLMLNTAFDNRSFYADQLNGDSNLLPYDGMLPLIGRRTTGILQRNMQI